jgi:hypothetical protein
VRAEISNPRRGKNQRWIVFIAMAFSLSRILYYILGIRFDAEPLFYFWQFLDVKLLRENLLESLFYLHSQPPLFNLLAGITLKLFPSSFPTAFHILYLLAGLALGITLFLIMANLDIPPRISFFLSLAFICGPPSVLYENWLFYTYPTALLLCLSLLLLQNFARTKSLRDSFLFFSTLSAVILTRSLFQLIWFLLCFLILIAIFPHYRRRLIFGATLPFLLATLLFVKNLAVFGTFTSSSWLGMNFSKMTTFRLGVEQREKMVRNGTLSRLALIPPFSSIEKYRPYMRDYKKTDIAVLDQETKSTGQKNLNHIAYVDISKIYLKDALAVLTEKPSTYAGSLIRAYYRYFLPSSDNDFLGPNREKIEPIVRLFDLLFFGRLKKYEGPTLEEKGTVGQYLLRIPSLGLFLLVGYPLLILYGLKRAKKEIAGKNPNNVCLASLLFILLSVLYVTALGNSLEVGENNRFRFLLDPFYLVLLSLFLSERLKTARLMQPKAKS